MIMATFYAFCDKDTPSIYQEQLSDGLEGTGFEFTTVYYLFNGNDYKREIPSKDLDSYMALQIPKQFITIGETGQKVYFIQEDGTKIDAPVSEVTVDNQFYIAYLQKGISGKAVVVDIKPYEANDDLNDDGLLALNSAALGGSTFINNDTSSRPICSFA